MKNSKEKQREYDKKRQGKRARGWAGVIYPESAPENWREVLEQTHIRILISPLHDQDLNADNSPKKSHRHVLFIFENQVQENRPKEILEQLNGTIPVILNSIEGYARYLIHADNPEKAQYSKDDVIELNGAKFLELAYGNDADDEILDEIESFILNSGVVSYARLTGWAVKNRPDWRKVIRRHTTHLSAFMRSLLWEAEGHAAVITGGFKDIEVTETDLRTVKP